MGTVHTKIVTVSFVNQPKQAGGKKGTIKTKDNEIYGVWADKLANFQQGKTYEIKYEESEYNGKQYKTVTNWIEQTAPPAGNGAGSQTNGNGSAYTAKDEQIFVCGALNNALAAGRVEATTVAMMAFVNAARETWRGTFGQVEQDPPY